MSHRAVRKPTEEEHEELKRIKRPIAVVTTDAGFFAYASSFICGCGRE
jgi:hypothetical protein